MLRPVFISITIIIFTFFFGINHSYPQNLSIEWQKCFGGSDIDRLNSLTKTPDGGYITAGYTLSSNGNITERKGKMDCWIVKLDISAQIEWQKCMGGSNADAAYSISLTENSGYIFAGYTLSLDKDVSGYHGQGDFWVVRLDSIGNIVWQKCMGGSDIDGANYINQTNDGGFIISGSTYSDDEEVSDNHGGADYWIIKLNRDGSYKWKKCYGGSSYESACSILETHDNGFIVTGRSESNDGDVSLNNGLSDIWVVKVDSSGEIEWQKCFGGSEYESGCSIIQLVDQSYVIAGTTRSNDKDVLDNHGGMDIWIIKITSAGKLIWQKCFGGSKDESASSIRRINNGFVVSGYTESNDGDVNSNHGGKDIWILILDELGNLQWQKCFGGSNNDFSSSIEVLGPDKFIIAGNTESNDGDVSGNNGLEDYWIIKLGSTTVSKIMENKNNGIKIFPNPFSSKACIEFDNQGNQSYTFILRDISGKIIRKTDNIRGNRVIIDRNNIPAGIYIYILKGKEYFTGKVVIN